MFTKGHFVTLECLKGVWEVGFDEPTGKRIRFEFKKASKEAPALCEVPTEVWYHDYFRHEHKLYDNFAQHLLDSYNKKDQYGEVTDPMLKVASVREIPVIERPVISEAPISKRKGKKNEEVSS